MRNVAQRDITKPTLEACRLLEEVKKKFGVLDRSTRARAWKGQFPHAPISRLQRELDCRPTILRVHCSGVKLARATSKDTV